MRQYENMIEHTKVSHDDDLRPLSDLCPIRFYCISRQTTYLEAITLHMNLNYLPFLNMTGSPIPSNSFQISMLTHYLHDQTRSTPQRHGPRPAATLFFILILFPWFPASEQASM